MLVSGTFPIAPFDGRLVAIYLANLMAMSLAYKLTSRGRGRLLMDEFFNMLNTFTLLQALWRFALHGRKVGAFVVTDKKGGGTSATAVFPHVAMLAVSMLAINWSVMGLGFGVTEDRFGAGIAIFWTIYNMTLVAGVIRLALRPSQRRDASRFRASFVVSATGGDTATTLVGTTADLSEGGCRLLWPEALPDHGVQHVDLHLPAGALRVGIEVVTRQAKTTDGWYPHGVRFVEADPRVADAINDALFDAVVPELLHGLRQPPLFVRVARDAWRAVHRRLAPRAARRAVRLPASLRAGGQRWRVTTRDLSASGVSVVSPIAVAAGTPVTVRLDFPSGVREQQGAVIRVRAIQTAGRSSQAWDLGLRFTAGAALQADQPTRQAVA